MMVQWCLKGLALSDDNVAKDIIDQRGGIQCNWWRDVHQITPSEIRDRLTLRNLNLHVNHFTTVDPVTGREFRELTPFISLSAGVVQRDEAAQTNNVHRSLRTALWFGSEFGQLGNAYILTCWLVLAPREAVAIESVAEEVRDLNSYRRYSAFQTEGEIVAKVTIPDNQILSLEKWERGQARQPFRRIWVYRNPRFTRPERLSNIRELI